MRLFRATLAVAASLLALASPALAQPVSWTGAGDGTSWNNPANWSPVGLPGATNDVTIPAGATAVNANTSINIRSLTLGRTVNITSCNILNTTNGVTFTGAAGVINTDILGCENLRFTGTQSVTGAGVINLNVGTMRVSGATTVLTIGTGVQINGIGANSTSITFEGGSVLNNQGTIRASGTSRAFVLGNPGGTFNNLAGGVVSSESSAVLTVASAWTNAGTFNVNAGTLSLGGSFTALGTVTRSGGTLELTGAFTGPTLNATAATGSINLGGSFTAAGSTIGASGGSSFSATGSPTFTNVTLAAPIVGSNATCGALTITGGLTFAPGGSITTGLIGCEQLRFQGNQTVGGNGTITLNTANARAFGGTTTFGPGITVTNAAGASGFLTIDPSGTIINQGSFVSSSGTLGLNGAGAFTNSAGATVGAQTGGTLTISTVNWSNAGTILVNAATVNLGGATSALGAVSRSAGTLNFAAIYNGPTLTATPATGDINLTNGAGFNGTTLSATGGAAFTSNGSYTFNAVTLAAPIQVGSISCGIITVTGGLTFAPGGSITTGNIGCEHLRFQGTQTVDGPGVVNVSTASISVTGGTVTFGPQMLITNATGVNGTIVLNAGVLVNNGTIRATGNQLSIFGTGTLANNPGATLLTQAGGTLAITQANWANNGTLNINGGTANLGGTTTQLGAITRTGGTLILACTYNNPALALTAATGNAELTHGFVANGATITATGGASFSVTGNVTFNGVTLGAPITGSNAACGILTIAGGFTFAAGGSLTTGNIGCEHIRFQGDQTVGGTGTITINSANISVFNGTATFGPGVTTTNAPGATGTIVINSSTLINQGILRAAAAGLTVTGQGAAAITNAPGGTMGAQSGGTFAVNNATWANNGTLLVNNATVNLAGTGNALGTVSRTGGTLTLSGSYTGATLALSASTGSVTLSSGFAITGTTLTATGGAEFIVAGNASFTGVTLGAALSLPGTTCGLLTISGGLTFAPGGSITTGNIGCEHLRFQGTQTVGGNGSITLNAASIGISGGMVTFGPGVTVANAPGSNAVITVTDNAQLINQGLVRVTGASRILSISAGATPTAGVFTNQGTLESRDDADFFANINLTNGGVIRVATAGTFTVPPARTLTNAAGGTLEVQGTGPNTTTDFGRFRVQGTLIAGGTLSVTYPNGLIPGCRVAVPVVTTQGTGTISGLFDTRTGPPKPVPFAIFFAVTPTGATFSSTNQADVGSAGGTPQPDGLLDNNDFVVFIDYFFSQNPLADRGSVGGVPGADGAWDNNDFVVYIDQFFAGCG